MIKASLYLSCVLFLGTNVADLADSSLGELALKSTITFVLIVFLLKVWPQQNEFLAKLTTENAQKLSEIQKNYEVIITRLIDKHTERETKLIELLNDNQNSKKI